MDEVHRGTARALPASSMLQRPIPDLRCDGCGEAFQRADKAVLTQCTHILCTWWCLLRQSAPPVAQARRAPSSCLRIRHARTSPSAQTARHPYAKGVRLLCQHMSPVCNLSPQRPAGVDRAARPRGNHGTLLRLCALVCITCTSFTGTAAGIRPHCRPHRRQIGCSLLDAAHASLPRCRGRHAARAAAGAVQQVQAKACGAAQRLPAGRPLQHVVGVTHQFFRPSASTRRQSNSACSCKTTSRSCRTSTSKCFGTFLSPVTPHHGRQQAVQRAPEPQPGPGAQRAPHTRGKAVGQGSLQRRL